jgi:glycosyltransferase involved in cell wall biosynthesis
VLLVIKGLGYGGAERLLADTVAARDRARFDYEVAYVLAAQDALVPSLVASGVPVHSLGATANSDLSWMARLRSLLTARRYDIVHTHLPYPATLGRLVVASLPAGRRPAVVYTEHSMWDKMALGLRPVNRATIGLDDRLLVVSEAARQALPRRLRSRAQVVIHGIDRAPLRRLEDQRAELRRDVRDELAVPEGQLLALTVANLRPEKGYDVLLRAARMVTDRGAPVRFAAAGLGPLDRELADQRSELELGPRFVFLGRRLDVPRLLCGADLFVLASRQEGLPVSVMEAASLGVPLVVTAVGGLPRTFTDGTDALVVRSEDPRALADAVVRLAGDPGLRSHLADGARRRADLFDVARSAAEVEAVYDEVSPGPGVR